MKVIKTTVFTENGAADGSGFITLAEKDGLCSLSADAVTDSPLDGARAVEIELEVPAPRFTAIKRIGDYWCSPSFCASAADIPPLTLCLLWEGGCILPVCGDEYQTYLSGTPDGRIKATVSSLCAGLYECKTLCLVTGAADVETLARFALDTMGSPIPLREGRKFPEVFEYLGWCSWDAFMTDVSEEKLLGKAAEFKRKSIPVRYAIIDDMWADCKDLDKTYGVPRADRSALMHKCSLNSFEADKTRFPGGLKHCISALHEAGLAVGMWHPTTGYWNGLTPGGDAAKLLGSAAAEFSRPKKDGSMDKKLMHKPDYDSAFKFYDLFHGFFEDCGADFVKVDFQSFTHMLYGDVCPVGQAAKNVNAAIDASVRKHFGGAIINCMGASEENMWHRPESAVSRCSDDFQPENREWFTKHILQCSFNSMVQGVFHVCDWDMWWTDDGQAVKNSVLRAISGGPVYISDTMDRSRREIVAPLCLSDGRLLRCDRPAIPLERCVFEDSRLCGKPFMVNGFAGGARYVAAFDLDGEDRPVAGSFTPRETGAKGDKFLIFEYFSSKAFTADADDSVDIMLKDRDDFRLYAVIPLEETTYIGLRGKMVGVKSFKRTDKGVLPLESGELLYYKDGALKSENV